jgi:hypothetical protein
MGCLLPLLAIPAGLSALAIGLFLLSAIPDPNSPSAPPTRRASSTA